MAWSKNPQSTLQRFLEVLELVVTRIVKVAQVLPVSATNATTMDLALGDFWTYTPTEATTITAINHAPGQSVQLLVQATGSSRVLTFGTGFATTGTLTTGTDATKDFVMNFISDGTTLFEVSRTAALTTA